MARPAGDFLFLVVKKFFLAALLLPALLSAQQVKHVLFLGNSYTAVNNLPGLVAQLARAGGDSISWDANTPGGYTLQLHSQDATTLSKISQRPWDYVVLQAQSQEPSLDTPYVQANVFPYARLLDSLIHVNDSCTQTVFYMTWGRKNGDASNCAAYPPVCTYAGMQSQLRGRYLQMAYDNHAVVAPAGIAWQNCIATNPAFDLYQADESHPSLYGSYLTACTFYATIFRQSPVGLNYYGGLTQNEATFLQNIAATTVLDSMSAWNTNVYYPSAAFTASIIAANTVQFTATDTTVTSWSWGDGNTFTPGGPNGTHTYPFGPPYTICLAVSNGCRVDTLCQTIQPTGIADENSNAFTIYPNPANDRIFITQEETTVTYSLYNSNGLLVRCGVSDEKKFSIATGDLAAGVYLLRLDGERLHASARVLVRGE